MVAEGDDDTLAPALLHLTHHGRNRVLVVIASQAPRRPALGWSLLASGASDVIGLDGKAANVEAITARLRRWYEIERLIGSEVVTSRVVGRDPAWVSVLRQVAEIARFSDDSVLLLGETGTGKEQVARLIHELDGRANKGEFVILDCSTIVPDLAGSEFFGHERGAFTSAISARDGAFAIADGGTLFLDEIGELPPTLQVQLLRVIQERMYKRVGSNTWRRTNFRLICATNRDLLNDGQENAFRRDLYYRIAGWVCALPALRDRTGDIIPLAEHFLRTACPAAPPALDEQVRDYLCSRAYPGNVRDLRNVVLRMLGRHVGPCSITIGDIPEDERPNQQSSGREPVGTLEDAIRTVILRGAGLNEVRKIAEETAIRIVTEDEHGNLQRAAKRLGVTDRTLQLRRVASHANGNGAVAATS